MWDARTPSRVKAVYLASCDAPDETRRELSLNRRTGAASSVRHRSSTSGTPNGSARLGAIRRPSSPNGGLRADWAQESLRATFEAGWSLAFSGAFSRKLSCSPGPLAHPEEQGTFNPKVPGSRPGRPTEPRGQFPVLRAPSEADLWSWSFDGSRPFQDLAEDGQDGSVLLASGRLLGADDVGQARHVDPQVLSQPLPRGTATQVFIALGPVREERNIEVAVVRDERPCGTPVEGVLVEWELDRTLDSRDAQRRIEFSQSRRESAQIRSLS